MNNLRWLLAALVAVALIPSGAWAQERATVTGTVVEQGTQRPLPGVQISIAGTNIGTLTNQQGRFLIPNVPAGQREVRATLIGYSAGAETVNVVPGQTNTVTFTLTQSAVAIEGLVVTASGERVRQREVGVAVGRVNIEDVPLAATANVSQLLQGRSAGVTVLQSSGTTGTGARIRIRGSNSVSLNNDPLLVIDGVRADLSTSQSIGVGGQNTSRLNDIPPEDIENIEILKGPAASALYGTAAANGVIVITTRKGRAGTTRWTGYAEQGLITEPNQYPANFRGFCTLPGAGEGGSDRTIAFCDLNTQDRFADRGIRLDSIQSFNPLMDPETRPFRNGNRQKYGVGASGGTDVTTFYLSGDFENEQGIYESNFLNRVGFRANVRSQLTEALDLTVNSGYVNSDARLPQNDNNILGVVSSAFLGGPTRESGFGFFNPEDIDFIDTRQNVERITGSANSNFRPLRWLTVVGTAGLDVVNRHDNQTLPAERVFFADFGQGRRTSNRIRVSNYSATLGTTANYGIRENISGTTSFGGQFNQEVFRGTYAFGRGLLAGTGDLSGTATGFAVNEVNTDNRTLGSYIQQQVSFNDRLFLTAAARGDQNSAFGTDFGFVVYPSVQASWVVSEEPFFPQVGALNSLRLRAALGQSGLSPRFRDAIFFLSPTSVTVAGQSAPAFVQGGIGNRELRPERSTEVELGFEASLIENRVGLEVTGYNKTSRDALIARRLAPSLGLSTTQFVNLGSVENSGIETQLNLRLLDTNRFSWDATVTGSWTRNELIDLGVDPATGERIEPIIFGLGGDTQRHQEGFPLGSYFQRTYTIREGATGPLGRDDVIVSDSAEFIGSPFPTRELSFQSGVTLGNIVRLSALVDHRGGYSQFNSTEEFRAGAFLNSQEAFDPTLPVDQQARYIATRYHGTAAGYIEDASFTKLREVSATFTVPQTLSQRVGAGGLSLTLAGRNLATWTNYTGLDPEINFAGTNSNFTTAEFLTQPPVRYFTARVDVNF